MSTTSSTRRYDRLRTPRTSALIVLGDLEPHLLPDEPLISTITLAELSVGPLVARTDEERAARQAHLQQAESDFDPIEFDAAAARAFGQVAASLRRRGRKPAVRAFDALIAAVAISRELPVYTGNPDDFNGIDGLVVEPVLPAGPARSGDVAAGR